VAEGSGGGFRDGETGLIVSVPAAEPIVGRWRSQFDAAAAAGVPAHITVLYPFLNRDRVDGSVLADLDAVIAKHQAFGLRLTQCRRFPGVLYLAPEPDTELRALTAAVTSRWPEAPPYRGQFADVVPHLTVAHGQDPEVLDMIESEVSGQLPVTARIESVQLIAYAGARWDEVRSFGLADGESQRR
jgi:2'-5' RNA ligase